MPNDNARIILISAATPDSFYQGIIDYTIWYNFDWLQQTEPDNQLCEFIIYNDKRPASWCKLIELKNALPKCEYAIWIDADCIIKPDTQLSDLLPDDKQTFRMLDDRNGCNSGLIVMPNAQWAGEFIDHWYNDALPEEIHHVWWENKTIIRMMRMPEYRDHFGEPISVDRVVHASGIPANKKLDWLKGKYETECNGR